MKKCSKKILKSYQVRKTGKQKDEFIVYLSDEIRKLNREVKIEESGIFRSRNIVVGDVDKAKIILGAHYDTCAQLPFPNFLTPKNILIYLLFNLLIVLGIFAIEFVVAFMVMKLTNDSLLVSLCCFAICAFLIVSMFVGKANPHTVNDNTSGVITLLEIMSEMKEDLKDQVAFVFFDHEEIGLIGSAQFEKKHRKALSEKLLINYDCVSDGDNIMLILSKRARKYEKLFREAFHSDVKNIIVTKASTTLFPSDQMNFKRAVGVAAFNRNRLFGYYLSRIHTPKDVVMDELNIETLKEGTLKFAEKMTMLL